MHASYKLRTPPAAINRNSRSPLRFSSGTWVTIPEVPFARLTGKNLSCKEIGGDFFDAVNTKDGLAVILADVSGKGVSAALLASTLQGMIYSQLAAGMGLTDIVTAVNR